MRTHRKGVVFNPLKKTTKWKNRKKKEGRGRNYFLLKKRRRNQKRETKHLKLVTKSKVGAFFWGGGPSVVRINPIRK